MSSERAEFFIKEEELLATPYHYAESGLDNIFLLNGVSERQTDYGLMVHIEDINGLHSAIGLHIIEKQEPMSGSEFRFLRKQMGLTQVDLANDFGVTDQTIANYEKDKGKGKSSPIEELMRLHYLLSVLPGETHVEAMQAFIRPPRRLPDITRHRLLQRWAESSLQAA